MRLTHWITLRSLRMRLLRTLLSTFGIILGVGSFLAIQVTNQAALVSLSALFEGTSGKTDLIITAEDPNGEGFPERTLNRIMDQSMVQAAVPSLQFRSALAQDVPDSTPLSLLGFDMSGFLVFGIDPLVDPEVREYNLTQGAFLSSDRDTQDIVLVEDFAAENELQVGQSVELMTPDGPQAFKIVGLIAKDGAGQNNNGAFGVIPLSTAQRLVNRSGQLDQIDILLKPSSSTSEQLDAVKSSLENQLGAGYAVTSAAGQGERVNQMLNGFSIGLNFMGGMALFVGGYLIYNAFSMTVMERTREFGLLRTLGLSRRQVMVQVLLEAALLGLVGSSLGILLGLGLAAGASRLFAYIANMEAIIFDYDPWTILFALIIGLAATLISALLPAWQAGRISPLEALRVRGVRKDGWLMRQSWKLGLLLLLVSSLILVVNPFPYDVQFRLGSITVVFLFFGGTLLIPGSVGLWEKLTRPLMRLLYGAAGQLGSSNLQRARLRTTLTVAALMVGIAMILVTRGMTGSFRGDLEVWINAYVGGDLMVSSSTPMRPQVMRRLEAVPGVAAVTPMRTLEVAWQRPDGETENLIFTGVDLETHNQVTSFIFSDSQTDVQASYRRLAAGDAIFISSVLAEKYHLQTGDRLRLRTRLGMQDFTIAGVVVDFFNQGLTVQGSWQDMYRYFKTDDASTYLLRVAPGYGVNAVKTQIEDLYAQRLHLSVVSNQTLIEQVLGLLNQAYSLFDAMAIIAVLVGTLGVVNTLTMNVVERTREIGMLRSIGLTSRQTLGMVLAESLLMGLIGGVLGLGFGVLLTRIFLWSMTAMSGYKIGFVMPLQAIIAGLLIALLVSQLAAILPARRAARLRILDAIQYE